MWIIDCNYSIRIIELNISNRIIIKFEKDYWKYENFISSANIFLNIDDKIFKVNPNKIKSHMIDVCEYKTKQEFIYSVKNNINIWKNDTPIQC